MLNHFTEDGDDIEANLTFVAHPDDVDVGRQLLTDEAFARLFRIADVPDREAVEVEMDQGDGAEQEEANVDHDDRDDAGVDQGPDGS